jgi:hypothetical protein
MRMRFFVAGIERMLPCAPSGSQGVGWDPGIHGSDLASLTQSPRFSRGISQGTVRTGLRLYAEG